MTEINATLGGITVLVQHPLNPKNINCCIGEFDQDKVYNGLKEIDGLKEWNEIPYINGIYAITFECEDPTKIPEIVEKVRIVYQKAFQIK
jgi:hypothetical protein